MQDRVAKNPKVAYAWNSVVAEVLGEKQDGHQVLTGVKLQSTKDESTRDLKIDGLFLAIGHVPNTAIFRGQLATTPDGYLLNRTALAWKGIEAAAGLARYACPTTARRPMSRGSSPAAMWSTPTTARRSPRPVQAVRPPWIARNGSKRLTPELSAPLSRPCRARRLNDRYARVRYHACNAAIGRVIGRLD